MAAPLTFLGSVSSAARGSETVRAHGQRQPLFSSRRLLSPAHLRLLTLLGVVSFFEGYDFQVITVALKPIRQTFGMDQASASAWIAIVYLGAIPAVFAAWRADRRGRRSMLLWAIVGYTVMTAATAAAPDLGTFVGFQFAARFFLVLESTLVWTIVAEELPAGARGFGFGWLAMLSALGTGWSSILNGTVISPLHLSWRFLYVAAIPVLLVVIYLRRTLGETGRFQAVAAQGMSRRWTEIARPPHRARLLLLCGVGLLANLAQAAVVYVVDFMETQRHLSASRASLTLVASGALAIPVLLLAGSLSDRVGRKPVLCSFLVVMVGGFYLFFHVAHGWPALFASLALVYMGVFGSWPTGTGFGAELFPTELRAFGNSFANGARYTAQALSFLVAGALIGAGSLPTAVLVLSGGPLVAAVLVAVFFPETGGRELEDISLAVSMPAIAGVDVVAESER